MGKASRRKAASRTRVLLSATESRLKSLGVDTPVVVQSDLPQARKISNALAKILESEVEEAISLDEYRHRLNAIVLAWNLSLLPPERQAKTLKDLGDFVEKTDPFGALAAQEAILRLMERKRAMFPNDKRHIISYDVQFIGNKVHVTAAALSAPEQPPSAP